MKKLANFLKNENKGFTLVEIIVVLAILAILIAVALPSMTGILNESKGKVLMQDARAALVAFQLKATDTDPATITKAQILTLIDKTGSTTVSIGVKLDASDKIVALTYADSQKVKDKAVLIISEGTEDDKGSVHDTFAAANTAGGCTALA